jgi:REP element-mobilizing transposase RayT
VFVTWRLNGSLPTARVFTPEHLTSGTAFLAWDRLLDNARSGPAYLRQPRIAGIVKDQLEALVTGGFCSLDAYVIMPNHVHVLWTPHISLPDLMRLIKGPTAREANKLIRRTGQRFWQEEYFDRLVRSDSEYTQIRRYIEWNPVKAALVAHPADFPWSSAYQAEAGLKPLAG